MRQTNKALRELYKEESRKLYKNILLVFAKISADSIDGKVYLNDLYRTNNYFRLLDEFNRRAKAIGGKQLIITEKSLIKTYKMAKEIVEKGVPADQVRETFVVPSEITPKQAVNQV